ncbi:MAG: beta-N-acetylhexosaminidase [Chloroflexota bacterium]|nr:beta-N-acetylhexosaminidase [Chloroflexota bacterium]
MSDITLFPQPQLIERNEGGFTLNADTLIHARDRRLGEMLANYLRPATGFPLPVDATGEPSNNRNVIRLVEERELDSPEAYRLTASSDTVVLSAAAPAGFGHGFQTLRQLLPPQILSLERDDGIDWRIPALSISDAPAFGWRGLHLDVGRHMFPVAFIKKFIDLLAFYKFNIFHWHLTEDQGWRIEIKKYPKLTEIGAYREETCLPGDRQKFDGAPYGGFYTQDQIRELVAYAGERGVTVVPEIELPGHSLAALTAYPDLGCVGKDYQVRTSWGIDENIYCAGNDDVFSFLKDVFSEVLALFPGEFIHIGGDEAPKKRWKRCPACQARIKAEGLKDEDELQSWFVRQFDSWLGERGRRLIGWDEILEGGLAPNATVMSWRGSDGGIQAANAGHDVVMTPTTYCYLDYYQAEDFASEPPALPAYLPLRKVYQFVVLPEAIADDKKDHILGGQGNLWTEYIPTSDHLEYMAYPRAIALAEVLWNHPQQRDYGAFLTRLQEHLPCLDTLGVNYRPLDD